MTPTEIITQNIKAIGRNPAPVLQWLAKLLKTKKAVLLRHGDSLLVLNKIDQQQAELHLFTMDKPMALMQALKDFVKKIKDSDLERVYGKADNQQIIKALGAVGVNVQESDKPKYNWMALVEG
jgi:hypothetical protein